MIRLFIHQLWPQKWTLLASVISWLSLTSWNFNLNSHCHKTQDGIFPKMSSKSWKGFKTSGNESTRCEFSLSRLLSMWIWIMWRNGYFGHIAQNRIHVSLEEQSLWNNLAFLWFSIYASCAGPSAASTIWNWVGVYLIIFQDNYLITGRSIPCSRRQCLTNIARLSEYCS